MIGLIFIGLAVAVIAICLLREFFLTLPEFRAHLSDNYRFPDEEVRVD